MPYTSKQKLSALCEEIAFRKHMRPVTVVMGDLDQLAWDRQIDILNDIAEDYWPEAEAEECAKRLL